MRECHDPVVRRSPVSLRTRPSLTPLLFGRCVFARDNESCRGGGRRFRGAVAEVKPRHPFFFFLLDPPRTPPPPSPHSPLARAMGLEKVDIAQLRHFGNTLEAFLGGGVVDGKYDSAIGDRVYGLYLPIVRVLTLFNQPSPRTHYNPNFVLLLPYFKFFWALTQLKNKVSALSLSTVFSFTYQTSAFGSCLCPATATIIQYR